MSTKVLVFESDPAFAGELRSELGKLGCNTTVVEDGNVGLQQAASDKPDLILLSIELPRMNGFSVCNKLKKDAALKDVPLIIMSSESSEETFEQHKKLRTRAEDYVHKPIAFGELLQHIQGFVQIGTDVGSEAETAIVIEEDIDAAEFVEEDVASVDSSEIAVVEPPSAHAAHPADAARNDVDADVDAFAESAFGRLTEPEAPAPAPAERGGANGSTQSRVPRRSVAPAASPRTASVRPSSSAGSSFAVSHVPAPAPAPVAVGVDPVEHERVTSELGRAKDRLTAAESELADAKREIDKLRMDAGEAEQLTREVEELKAKLAAGAAAPKGGAVSSREFLDLREGLNRKDKEILALKEQLSKKDKEIVETQEKMLAFERSKADLDDKLLVFEREIEESKEKLQALSGETERAKKLTDELKVRLDKAHAEIETKDGILADLKAKSATDVSALEAKLATARAEFEQTLADARAEHERAVAAAEARRQTEAGDAEARRKTELDEAEARRKAELDEAAAQRRTDLDQAKRDLDAALAGAGERAAQDQKQALDAQAEQLTREHGERLEALKAALADEAAAARQAHQRELEAARGQAAEALRVADQRREDELAQARTDAQERLAQALDEAGKQAQTTLEALRQEHTEKVSAIENDRDARIATAESRAARELNEANDRLAKLEVDFSGVRGELESLRATKRSDDATFAMKTADLEARLAETAARREELERTLTEKTERLQTESARADRAQSKWESDRQSLDRAKDALAVALSQIEEAEGRTL